MHNKLWNVVGCALMALAMLAPTVSAHNNGGYTAAAGAPIANGGGLGTDSPPAAGYVNGNGNGDIRIGTANDYVSGRYVSSHQGGPAVLADGTVFNIDVGADVNLLPHGIFLPAGGAFCDMEVAVDDPTFPGNEKMVDAKDVSADAVVPNGLFDDGGLDGACHVTSYASDGFSTAGCPATTVKAYAEDAVSGSTVFTAAACDLETLETPSSSPVGLVALALCELNEAVLQTDPTAVTTCIETYFGCTTALTGCTDTIVDDETGCATALGLADCITSGPLLGCVLSHLDLTVVSCVPAVPANLVGINHCNVPTDFETDAENCLIHIVNCELGPDANDGWKDCFYPPTPSCGSDGLTDVINYGEGGLTVGTLDSDMVHGLAATGAGVPWPAAAVDSANCSRSSGAAQQYVMDGVHVTLNLDLTRSVSLSLATTGFVDSA